MSELILFSKNQKSQCQKINQKGKNYFLKAEILV
jgi:hypothetical protein